MEPVTDPLLKYSPLRACVYHSVFRSYKHKSEVEQLALHLFRIWFFAVLKPALPIPVQAPKE